MRGKYIISQTDIKALHTSKALLQDHLDLHYSGINKFVTKDGNVIASYPERGQGLRVYESLKARKIEGGIEMINEVLSAIHHDDYYPLKKSFFKRVFSQLINILRLFI